MLSRLTLALFALFTLGCLSGGKGFGAGDTAFLGISDGEVICDPAASAASGIEFGLGLSTSGDS